MLLCISTVRTTLAGFINTGNRPKKDAERRTKRADVLGRPRDPAGFVKSFRLPAMLKKDTAGLLMKRNLRVKRRDPWRRANALSKTAADPVLMVETRKKS